MRESCIAVGLELDVAKEISADALALAAALDIVRAAKDFAKADALRAELQAFGYLVEMTKAGTTLRRARLSHESPRVIRHKLCFFACNYANHSAPRRRRRASHPRLL